LLNFTGRGWVRPSASPFPSPMLPGGLWPRYHVRPSSSHRCLGSGVFWNGARLVSVHPSQDRDGALAAAPILDTPPPAAPTKRPPAGLTAMVPPSRPFHRSAQERPGSRATMSGTPAPPSRSLRATWTEEVGSSVLGKQRASERRRIAPPVPAELVRVCARALGDPPSYRWASFSVTCRPRPHLPSFFT